MNQSERVAQGEKEERLQFFVRNARLDAIEAAKNFKSLISGAVGVPRNDANVVERQDEVRQAARLQLIADGLYHATFTTMDLEFIARLYELDLDVED